MFAQYQPSTATPSHPGTYPSPNKHITDLDSSDEELEEDLTFHNIVNQLLTNHIPAAEDMANKCGSTLSTSTPLHSTLSSSTAPSIQPPQKARTLSTVPTQSATAGQPPSPTASNIQTHVPLENLFDYSQHTDTFESVWAGGVKSLADELAFYDISVPADTN
ncbi:hypothetical protein PAXRUDRAFT_162776 [Paxillus rubicundulus Ve08.2h10]|uniref:Uncharacterized protein n=1 Tax=Paxillus rubicundulus Ve08.2h10 TaxID=930991 RepID=A0A0D0D5L0_9AGAM|nr:hypothetical protein PAXRUDRAFT_162776 [Paxillus rubicundulus Ve08.2h10]